jgi:hypothetical protein
MSSWERIDPGQAPGGLVFRLTADGRVWREYGITPDTDTHTPEQAEADALQAIELADRYGESRLYIYDGDTGECVSTAITER